jgi:nucleoid-associated protein YgaU
VNQLERITFHRLDRDGRRVRGAEARAQFNPTEITFEKGAQIAEIAIPGLDAPILQFVRGASESLSLDLFFDSTESGTAGSGVRPVTEETDRFYQLLKIDGETHAPPVLQVTWGEGLHAGSQMTGPWAGQNREAFQCVVESVQQRFTLFSPEGTPLRATLSVKLKEYKTLDQQIAQIDFRSPDRTRSWVVAGGDTLSGIAGEVYGDPGAWRAIADHNDLDDPSRLSAGAVLEIPPLS